MASHYKVTLADALSAHDRALKVGPGIEGVPNPGLIESAIARPYNGYHRSIAKKSAALVESVSRNHGFADGNKRTTLILLHTFLTRSGYRLTAIQNENLETALETMVLDVVTGTLNFDQLVAWFKARIRKKRVK